MILTKEEIKCVQTIAKWFKENKTLINRSDAKKELGVDDATYEVLIKRMEFIGAVEKVLSTSGGYAAYFRPSAYAVELAGEIELETKREKAPPDLLEQFKTRVRRNPKTAWPLIVVVALALLIPLINSLIELIEKIVHVFTR